MLTLLRSFEVWWGSSKLTFFFAHPRFKSGQLYEPYTDNPETRGFMRIPTEVLNDVIPKFLRDGWQVVSDSDQFVIQGSPFLFQNIHAIGDRAHGIVLDAFEHALVHVNVTALRPRLEHAQIMTRADMARLGKLGGK